MKALLLKALDYLRYPSTWKGIATALTVVGVNVSPDQSNAIVTAGAAVIAVIFTFFSDVDVVKTPPDAAKGESGFAVLPLMFIVMLAGLSINGYNAQKAGHPVESLKDVKHAAVASYHARTADYSHLNQ